MSLIQYISLNITLHPAHCCNTLISLITHMSESLTTYTGLHAICNRYNCLHFVHQFIHRFLSITLLSFTFVSRRILHIAADPLPLLISNPCAHIPLSFSFGLLTVLHHLIVGQSNAEACSRLQMRVIILSSHDFNNTFHVS